MNPHWSQWDLDTWREWSPSELADQVSPSSMVANRDISPYLAQYRAAGEHVVADPSLHARVLSYGDHPDEILTFVPAHGDEQRRAPTVVFIHGGYWQALSHTDALFPAASFVQQGFHYMSVNYSLAPGAPLALIVEQVERCLRWIAMNPAVDQTCVALCGHSAGAHLAAINHQHLPESHLALFGGVFDLEPLVGTPINDAVGLDEETARALSPMVRPIVPCHALFVCGEHETVHFKFQSRAYAARRAQLDRSTTEQEVPNTNHFDVVFTLCDPDSPARQWITTHLTKPNPS